MPVYIHFPCDPICAFLVAQDDYSSFSYRCQAKSKILFYTIKKFKLLRMTKKPQRIDLATETDEVLIKREQIRRQVKLGKRVGYLLMLISIVSVVLCWPLHWPKTLVVLEINQSSQKSIDEFSHQ